MSEVEYKEAVKNMRNRTTRMDREGDYWTDDEKRELERLFNQQVDVTEIAVRLQRTEPAIMQKIEKLDLYQRKENPQRRRNNSKEADCLCNTCRVDESACPLRRDCRISREGD